MSMDCFEILFLKININSLWVFMVDEVCIIEFLQEFDNILYFFLGMYFFFFMYIVVEGNYGRLGGNNFLQKIV